VPTLCSLHSCIWRESLKTHWHTRVGVLLKHVHQAQPVLKGEYNTANKM
jgi:hypothetical protein